MNADRIIEVLLGLLTLVVGFAGFWLASRSTGIQGKAAVKAVDAGAFERAREIYESAMSTLRGELNDTRSELASARSDLIAARTEIAGLRQDMARLEEEIRLLRQQTGNA